MQTLARLALLAVPLGGGTAFLVNRNEAPPAAVPQNQNLDVYDVARARAAREARAKEESAAARAMLARELALFRLAPELHLAFSDGRKVDLAVGGQLAPREFRFAAATVRIMIADTLLIDGVLPGRTLLLVRGADGWHGSVEIGSEHVAVHLAEGAPW